MENQKEDEGRQKTTFIDNIRMDWNEESSGFPGNSRQRSLEGDSFGGTTSS